MYAIAKTLIQSDEQKLDAFALNKISLPTDAKFYAQKIFNPKFLQTSVYWISGYYRSLENTKIIMKILYDISVLGMSYYHSRARTGVFRVVENIAYGLANSEECDLSFCASQSLRTVNYSLDYLKANLQFEDIPFFYPKLQANFNKVLDEYICLIDKKNLYKDRTKASFLFDKSVRKILCHISSFTESLSTLIDVDILRKTNIFHSPFYPLPESLLCQNKRIQKFLTIYDLIPILFPEFFAFNENHLIKSIVEGLSPDNWIFCISESTKNDLCNYTNKIDPSKVFVTDLAASELFYHCSNTAQIKAIRQKYGIPNDVPYVLSLSTLEPRKNIDQTIRCFANLVQQERINDLYLVLVGTKGWDYDKIFEELSQNFTLKDKIILTGYVLDEDLAALYSGAMMFVYPSFYEGFGLPPLEAMQCGTPVITSNTSSLPEVVGDAGIMISPTDTDALCQSMLEIYSNSSLREIMSLKSIEKAKKFSWQKCTQETINAYKIALSYN